MRQKLLFAFVLVGLLMAQPACSGPLTYSAEAIEAWVVDAETKKPLEGVVVTANWQLEEGTFGGNVQVGQLVVMETVSDKNGRFYFPPWGPKKALKGHLTSEDPQLLLFKSSYEYRRLNNTASSDRRRALQPIRRSEWNGKTIALKRFNGTATEYAKHLSFLQTSINSILYRDKCGWKRIPQMIVALDRQETYFRNRSVYSSLQSLNALPNNECGSPSEVLREFML